MIMKIKDYKCKCGHDDFFFADKGSQRGIYCSYCGKWLKWADKDEQNLAMKQEPKTGRWIKVHPLQENDEGDYMCSECKCGGLVWKPTTYCPNCGAKMADKEQE